jgi:hypothetical protein
MRMAWLDVSVRNGSGNGGGVLLGFMPLVRLHYVHLSAYLMIYQLKHPLDTDSQPKSVQLAYQRTKTKTYHDVLDIIFRKTRQASHSGKIWQFGDGKTRRGYPDILIKSLDMQEAYAMCSCRAYPANFPCVKCLVPYKEQHDLRARFELRTKENMGAVYEAVEAETRKTYKNSLLKDVGLHKFKVSTCAITQYCSSHETFSLSIGGSGFPIHTERIVTIRVTTIISGFGESISGR